jgi:hypothetical protein
MVWNESLFSRIHINNEVLAGFANVCFVKF